MRNGENDDWLIMVIDLNVVIMEGRIGMARGGTVTNTYTVLYEMSYQKFQLNVFRQSQKIPVSSRKSSI